MTSPRPGWSARVAERSQPAHPAPTPALCLVVAAVLALDQVTKLAVIRSLAEGESAAVVRGILYITHVRNSGAAFSMFRGSGAILALLAVVGIVVLAVVIVRRPPRLVGFAASLVAGGAVGNLTDRMVRGTVVDFVDLNGKWPAFNVADSAITVGVVLLLLTSGRKQPEVAREVGDQA